MRASILAVPDAPEPAAMPPTVTEAEFAALLARSGLSLPADQRAALLSVWPAMQAMQDAVRSPAPGLAPLSAAVFRADRGA